MIVSADGYVGLGTANPYFTRTQRKILDLLQDGQPHTRRELQACLPDVLAVTSTLWVHIHNIRRKLRAHGQDIICEVRHRKTYYRHIQLLMNAKLQPK